MTEQGDPLQETTTPTPLRDFARARFYNYTVLQLVPHYIELRKARSRRLSRDTQNTLAASLHERIMNASMYAAIGQIADPNSVLSALLQHLLEQSNQGESSATYLPQLSLPRFRGHLDSWGSIPTERESRCRSRIPPTQRPFGPRPCS